MNLLFIILQIFVSILNHFPNIEKKVSLELNNYILELNVTQFHVKQKH